MDKSNQSIKNMRRATLTAECLCFSFVR